MPRYSYFEVSGIRTFVRHVPDARLVRIQAVVESGAQEDRIPGQAHFLEHVAGSRKNNRSFLETMRIAERMGVDYNAWTNDTHTTYHATGLVEDAEHLAEHIRNTLSPEAFREEDVERERGAIIQEIRMYDDQPDYHLHALSANVCFAGPFASTFVGTIDSVNATQTQDLRDFLVDHVVKNNLVMVFSGGVSPEQARILIEKFFSDVSNAPYRFEKIRGRIPFHGLKQWKSDKFEQSHVALSVMLPEGVSEIETAAFLTALSGGFSSPLFDTVRNEMKIAYSIGASVQHVSRNPIFTFYGNTDEQKVLDLIRGCKIALVKLRNTPEREILRTRKSLLLSAARASSAIIGSPDELLFAYQRTGLFPPSAEEIAKFADNLSPEVFRNHAQMIIDLLPSAAVAIVGGQAQYSPENFSEECTKILSVG